MAAHSLKGNVAETTFRKVEAHIFKFTQTKALMEFLSIHLFLVSLVLRRCVRALPVAVPGLCLPRPLPAAEHRLRARGFQWLQRVVSVVVTHRC